MSQNDLKGFKNYLNTKGFSKLTIRSYLSEVGIYLEFCSVVIKLNPLEHSSVHSYFNYLLDQQKYKPQSLEVKRAAIVSLFLYLSIIYNKNFVLNLEIKLPRTKKTIPNHLTQKDIKELLSLFDKKSWLSHRNFFIVLLFYSTGIRVSELISLAPENINEKDGCIKIIGKGNKERLTYMPEKTIIEYKVYYERFNDVIQETGKIFFNKNKKPLGIRGVQFILSQIPEKTKFYKKLHPHIFRHSFATHLLGNGADIRKIGEILGHESLNTTQKYTHLQPHNLKKVIDEFHPHSKIKE